MKGLNKAILIGNLGKDPEISTPEGGVSVAKFTIATNESHKDAQGNTQTITDSHNVVAWRNLADMAGKYSHKASHIYLEGKTKTRSYEDKDKIKRYTTDIVADGFIMLGKPETSTITDIYAIA